MADQNDINYLGICIYEEARGEPDDGQHAIGRVIFNRMKKLFFSDGTIKGTVLRKDQFSWAYFQMVDGKYTRVCETEEEADALAQKLMVAAESDPTHWSKACAFATEMLDNTYAGGPDYDKLTDETLMYCNLAISKPVWAVPSKEVCVIGHHTFYTN